MKHLTLTVYAALLFLFSCNSSGNEEKPKTDSSATAKTEAKPEAAPATPRIRQP